MCDRNIPVPFSVLIKTHPYPFRLTGYAFFRSVLKFWNLSLPEFHVPSGGTVRPLVSSHFSDDVLRFELISVFTIRLEFVLNLNITRSTSTDIKFFEIQLVVETQQYLCACVLPLSFSL